MSGVVQVKAANAEATLKAETKFQEQIQMLERKLRDAPSSPTGSPTGGTTRKSRPKQQLRM